MKRIILAAATALSGCVAAPEFSFPEKGLRVARPSVSIIARSEADLAGIAAASGRAVARPGRIVEESAAPFLYAAPLGRAYLDTGKEGRALALGEPPRFCPAAGLATEATGPAEAARAATRSCLGALEKAHAPDACGCRVIAVEDALTAPIDRFAYAPRVGARLIGLEGLSGAPLTAEEGPSPAPGAIRVVFSDAAGPRAVADLRADGGASLRLLGRDGVFEGRRELRGWRRGRLSERLLLSGPAGERLIALIGFEPGDIAAEGAQLAAWPRDRGEG